MMYRPDPALWPIADAGRVIDYEPWEPETEHVRVREHGGRVVVVLYDNAPREVRDAQEAQDLIDAFYERRLDAWVAARGGN